MILPRDRKLATVLLKLRLFTWGIQKNELFNRCPRLRPTRFTRWIWDRMRKRQTRDGLHHAPMCPGNEWSGAELVCLPCNCGAARRALAQGGRGDG